MQDNQNGFILVTTLVFLLLLSLITVSILETGIVQLKINQNSYSNIDYFQASESALRIAENLIRDGRIFGNSCFDRGLRGINEIASRPLSWWYSNACSQTFESNHTIKKLYYWVEEISSLRCGELYKGRVDKVSSSDAMSINRHEKDNALEKNEENEKKLAKEDEKIAITYYRITSLTSSGDAQNADSGRFVLQSTFAKAVSGSPCESEISIHSLGRQSWREVVQLS